MCEGTKGWKNIQAQETTGCFSGVGQGIECAMECDKGTKECDKANSRVDVNMQVRAKYEGLVCHVLEEGINSMIREVRWVGGRRGGKHKTDGQEDKKIQRDTYCGNWKSAWSSRMRSELEQQRFGSHHRGEVTYRRG